MADDALVGLADLDRAIAASDPRLGDLIVRYLAQSDPQPGRSEYDPDGMDAGDDAPEPDVPDSAYTHGALVANVWGNRHGKTGTEQKLARVAAFAAAEASPFAPPRLRLYDRLLALYERGDAHGRAALVDVFARGEIKWGMWRAAKAIYKLAEARYDAELFGALAARFDTAAGGTSGEVRGGTLLYLRRRAWRFLRLLGKASPDAYVAFAVEVLRHYPAGDRFPHAWIQPQIAAHAHMTGRSFGFVAVRSAAELGRVAFREAWLASPAPLLGLLESAPNEGVCAFAILILREHHALALRAVAPAWLAQLGKRPIGAIHDLVVELLRASPELHQSKLRALGLHDVVIGFLRSPAAAARAYALEYAAAHAPDLAVDELVALIDPVDGERHAEVVAFAGARLEAMAPKAIGIAALCRLVDVAETPWAAAKLRDGFVPADLDLQTFVDTALRVRGRNPAAYNALVAFYSHAHAAIPARYLTALLDDARAGEYTARAITTAVLTDLGKRSARDIGVAWIQRAAEDGEHTAAVQRWLDAGMLSGADLDLDWLRALVAKPRMQALALRILGDRRRVEPSRIGLPWLLDLARSTTAPLASFAQRMLLESFEPADFGGVAQIWALATGTKQPDAVRAFAATYLKAHHPELSPEVPEARALGIKPRLGADAYAQATVRPLLGDERADVRRLAVAIAGAEVVRWNAPELVYELAGSPHREPRALGAELLLATAGELSGAPTEGKRVPAAWIDGRRLFQLAESAQQAAREVALTLIRKLYDRVGGAERLAWLMDSPDRDVRLFAVRLFWDRHRPRALPSDYAPRVHAGAASAAASAAGIGTAPFADVAALRQFARVMLFGLPPGRLPERDPVAAGAPVPERPLAATVAKRRLIEALRDVADGDVDFARAIAPVLGEMASSIAKGEWQASLQAIVQLRARHGDLGVELTGAAR